MHPSNTQEVYVATDVGVYYSSDGGVSFLPVSSYGLSNAPVAKFAFYATSNTLYAFSHGRGVYPRCISLFAYIPHLQCDTHQWYFIWFFYFI